MLSFTFVRRKAIGYFLLATLLPVLFGLQPRLKREIDLPADQFDPVFKGHRSTGFPNLTVGTREVL